VVRLLPALNIQASEVEQALIILDKAFVAVEASKAGKEVKK